MRTWQGCCVGPAGTGMFGWIGFVCHTAGLCDHAGKARGADRASWTQWSLGSRGGEEGPSWFCASLSCRPAEVRWEGQAVRLPRSPQAGQGWWLGGHFFAILGPTVPDGPRGV